MITPEDGQNRIDDNNGKYVYFFSRGGKEYCLDAMLSHNICKFINDSPKKYSNSYMKIVDVSPLEPPKLALFSKKRILEGEELRYSYDESDNMWWRSKGYERYLKPLHLMPGYIEVSIDDANKAIIECPSITKPKSDRTETELTKNNLNMGKEPIETDEEEELTVAKCDRIETELTKNNLEMGSEPVETDEEEEFMYMIKANSRRQRKQLDSTMPTIDASNSEYMEYLSESEDGQDDSGISLFGSNLKHVEDVSFRTDIEDSDKDDGDYLPSFSDENESESTDVEVSLKESIEKVLGKAKDRIDFEVEGRNKSSCEIQKDTSGSESNSDIDNSNEDKDDPKQLLVSKLKKMNKRHRHGHKGHNCTYCGGVYSKLPRHLMQKHPNEAKVMEAMSYDVYSKERKQKWIEIRREGDFKINIEAFSQDLPTCPVRIRKRIDQEKLSCDGCK